MLTSDARAASLIDIPSPKPWLRLQLASEPWDYGYGLASEGHRPYPKGQHPGRTWHKTDFWCDPPRDLGWIGPSNVPGGTLADETERQVSAIAFIAECLARP
jgi:CubicO group peptidase (beta-lactamase class C family)